MDLIDFDGVALPPKYGNWYKRILDFNVRENDVWICTYPKCGTTWTQEMVWLICNDLDYEKAKSDLIERSQFLEYSSLLNREEMFKSQDFQSESALSYLRDSTEVIENLKVQRIIKTHLAWNLLPKQIQNFQKRVKIIHVNRNAKDSCTSYYYFYKYVCGYKGSFDDFSQLYLDGNVLHGSYWNYLSSFQKHRNEPNILFIKYEDMKRNLPEIIRKTATFLGKKLSEEEIEILAKHLSFESMRNNPFVNKDKYTKSYKKQYGIIDENVRFMRRGQVDDYKNFMSSEFIEKFDEMDRKLCWENK